MNRAQNSDSKTHAEKSNPTSRTDYSSKTLWDIFLGHPVCLQIHISNYIYKFTYLTSFTNLHIQLSLQIYIFNTFTNVHIQISLQIYIFNYVNECLHLYI